MKKKTVFWILFTECVLFTGINILFKYYSSVFPELVTFPFYQISLGLNALADLGQIGSGAAMFLYALICLSPLFVLLFSKKKPDGWKIASLCVMCVVLAIGMLGLADVRTVINANVSNAQAFRALYRGICGGLIYSGLVMVIAVFCIRNIKEKFGSETVKITRIGLYILCAAFFTAVIQALNNTVNSIIAYAYIADIAMFVTETVMSAVIFGFMLRVLFACAGLLSAYDSSDMTEELLQNASNVAKYSGNAVLACVFYTVAVNTVRLILARYMSNANFSFDFPLIEVGIMILIMMISKLIEKNRQLSDENNLII